MNEIHVAKADCCPKFRQNLPEREDNKVVDTVKSDRFWSCGLSPLEASTIKPPYHPGENHHGCVMEHIRPLLVIEMGKISQLVS